jgi:hypothetical protein
MVTRACTARRLGSAAASMLVGGGLVLAATAPANAARSPGWRIVQTLGSTTGQSSADSIDAISASDAWAAASVGGTSGAPSLLVERWSGTAWRTVPGAGKLAGTGFNSAVVTADSATDAWVFAQTTQSAADVTYALRWHHGHWARSKFAPWQLVTSAAALSPTDVWAFGLNISGPTVSFAKRYNGRSWSSVSEPNTAEGVSATGPDDIWTVGEKLTKKGAISLPIRNELSRWTGSSWHSIPFPRVTLPSKVAINNPQVLALGTSNVWVITGLSEGQGVYPGGLLLHWNGAKWRRVYWPYSSQTPVSIASDGHGGFWIESLANISDIDHYSRGKWTKTVGPMGSASGVQLSLLSWVPGTQSVWAGGGLLYPTSMAGEFTTQGVIEKYGP